MLHSVNFLRVVGFIILCTFSEVTFAKPIRIGVSCPLTGNASTYGTDIKNTILFANEALGSRKYEFVFEDDKCSGKEAVSVARKLINVDGIEYVLGVPCDGAFLAAAPVYAEAGVLVISLASAQLPETRETIFNAVLKSEEWPKVLYDQIARKHLRIGIISEETDFPQEFLKNFLNQNKASKLNVFTESFLTGTTDYQPTLLKFRMRNVEAVFINTQTEETFFQVLKQLHEINLDVVIYGVVWPGTTSFLKRAGKLANDIVFLDFPSLDTLLDEKGLSIYAKFLERYGPQHSSEVTFIVAYEAFRALDEAIQRKQEAGKFLKAARFKGLFGDWHFDEQNFLDGLELELKTIEDGKVTTIQG